MDLSSFLFENTRVSSIIDNIVDDDDRSMDKGTDLSY